MGKFSCCSSISLVSSSKAASILNFNPAYHNLMKVKRTSSITLIDAPQSFHLLSQFIIMGTKKLFFYKMIQQKYQFSTKKILYPCLLQYFPSELKRYCNPIVTAIIFDWVESYSSFLHHYKLMMFPSIRLPEKRKNFYVKNFHLFRNHFVKK